MLLDSTKRGAIGTQKARMAKRHRNGCGLFYSSLDTQQTSVEKSKDALAGDSLSPADEKRMNAIERMMAGQIPPAAEVELAYRHRSWMEDRERVALAMATLRVPMQRLDRFLACGAGAVVEYSADGKQHRIKAFYCGDRLCEPCSRARADTFRRAVLDKLGDRHCRFLTLTRRSNDAFLTVVIDELLEAFRRLRQTKIWTENVTGGVGVVEIKTGSGSMKWHVHLHCIIEGNWVDQRKLSNAWKRATRGSFIVDLRDVGSNNRAVGYVAAYASKGWSREVLADPEKLAECVVSLRGRRLFVTFGSWYGTELESERPTFTDWKVVGRLGDIVEASLRGEPWAVGTLRSLRVIVGTVDGRHIFIGRDPVEEDEDSP